jgi:tetratricopeptide (TPR) repeat protein
VQALYDQKKYEDARASFTLLSDLTKTSFDGQLLLCRIEQERNDYRLAIQACDMAIQSRPNVGDPYGLNAVSLLTLGDTERAEAAASKAAQLSEDYKSLLAMIYYSEEKYELVQRELSADSNNTFDLTLLTGAAFHDRDYDSFRRFRDKVTALKGDNNGWALLAAGVAAERDLKWDVAIDKYKKCDADSTFTDPICLVAAVRAELSQINYSGAKSDMDSALTRYPKNHTVLSEGVFVNLLVGNTGEADSLHELLQTTVQNGDETTECIYYYGRNQPLLATSHCEAAIKGNENNYSAWSNAGYAALDNGDFQSAVLRFSKATQLYEASKDKHTGTQALDVCWGLIVASYYSGDKKDAKTLYRAVKKNYPEFGTTAALKQLPGASRRLKP